MKVRDLMTSVVITVRPETSLKKVGTILARCGISGVPVVDADGRVIGVVSEGDILFKERGPSQQKGRLARRSDTHAKGDELKVEAQTAAQAMTAPAKTIAPWRPVSAAAAQMLEEGVNRLPVVDDESRLVGIVTRADLVRAFVRPDAEIRREIRDEVLERALLLETPRWSRSPSTRGRSPSAARCACGPTPSSPPPSWPGCPAWSRSTPRSNGRKTT